MKNSISSFSLYFLNSFTDSYLLTIQSTSIENNENNGVFMEEAQKIYFQNFVLKSFTL